MRNIHHSLDFHLDSFPSNAKENFQSPVHRAFSYVYTTIFYLAIFAIFFSSSFINLLFPISIPACLFHFFPVHHFCAKCIFQYFHFAEFSSSSQEKFFSEVFCSTSIKNCLNFTSPWSCASPSWLTSWVYCWVRMFIKHKISRKGFHEKKTGLNCTMLPEIDFYSKIDYWMIIWRVHALLIARENWMYICGEIVLCIYISIS